LPEEVKLGKSYDAGELAKLCGMPEDQRYCKYVFEGDKAAVIAEDEGNGVVKVVKILSEGR